jgi:hypothetical protein
MGCGGRSKQRPYETGAAKNYDGPDFARDICQGELALRTATKVKRAGGTPALRKATSRPPASTRLGRTSVLRGRVGSPPPGKFQVSFRPFLRAQTLR